MKTDATGLYYEVEPPRSAIGDHVYELVARCDVSESSFAFVVQQDSWSTTEQHYPLRRLESVKLVDVSAVDSAAYVDSSAGLRSLAERFAAPLEDVERLAAEDELRRLFPRRMDGRVALSLIGAPDPWEDVA